MGHVPRILLGVLFAYINMVIFPKVSFHYSQFLATTEGAEFAEEVNLFFRVFRVFRSFSVFLGCGQGPGCVYLYPSAAE